MEPSSFNSTLIAWYQQQQRDLPWRRTRDPYRIWLSEVILQQTRVDQGLSYYHSFCENFPEVSDLARAGEQQVLRLWQGLGYYSRARNLLRCARSIMEKYSGRFPEGYSELVKLPGIGDYTASAIASFAFGQATPVIDGNVFRVLSRLFGIRDDIAMPKSRKVFKNICSRLMEGSAPDQFNQAIMEFGALHCTPRKPKCNSCPFAACCQAYIDGTQHLYPFKSKKNAVRDRYFYYYVIKSGANILLKKREKKDIWQGLYDFMLVEFGHQTDPMELLAGKIPNRTWMDQIQVGAPSEVYRHKLTHQQIIACFLLVETNDEQTFWRWKQAFELKEFNIDEVHELPKPILIDNYLKADIF